MSFSAQHITVNNRQVRYYEAGEPHRQVLFLLHGGFGDAQLHWEETAQHFQRRFYIIAPDLPGYGETEPLPRMSINALVTWARDLLEALGLDDAVVIGNSFGGLIARLLAAQHPRYASTLVLVNGGVIPDISPVARLLARTPIIGSGLFNRLATRMTTRSELELGIENHEMMTDEFMEKMRADRPGLSKLLRALASSPQPTETLPKGQVLLLWGEEDAITPARVGKAINKAIPDSRLEIISQCRHMPHLELPDVFQYQLESFLKDLSGPTL